MGSLGPTFAEMFMAYFEKKYMELIKEHGVVLWLRFVNDILLFFKDTSKSTELLANLNKKHPNIKFTEERETLDILTLDEPITQGLQDWSNQLPLGSSL
jgi:hypothetical protein